MPVWWVGSGRNTILILLLSGLAGFILIGLPFHSVLSSYRVGPIGWAGIGILAGALINYLFVVRKDPGVSSLYSIPVKAWTFIMLAIGIGLMLSGR